MAPSLLIRNMGGFGWPDLATAFDPTQCLHDECVCPCPDQQLDRSDRVLMRIAVRRGRFLSRGLRYFPKNRPDELEFAVEKFVVMRSFVTLFLIPRAH